jgi:hypothetical protein
MNEQNKITSFIICTHSSSSLPSDQVKEYPIERTLVPVGKLRDAGTIPRESGTSDLGNFSVT